MILVIQASWNMFQNLSSLSGISLGIIPVQKICDEGLVYMVPTVSAHNFERWPSEKEKRKQEF